MPDRTRHRRLTGPRRSRGFSLVEIASISFILALTVGAVIKGQELIASARTRSVLSQVERYRLATLGFQDRFRALPGDYGSATTSISGTPFNGNGNGRIESFATSVPAGATAEEEILAFDHLSKAGFVGERFDFSTGTLSGSLPVNIYGGYLSMAFDNLYGNPGAPPGARHNLKTGNNIPAAILAEIDRKVDDGNGLRGLIQFSDYAITGAFPAGPGEAGACVDTSGVWRVAATPAPVNCGAAVTF